MILRMVLPLRDSKASAGFHLSNRTAWIPTDNFCDINSSIEGEGDGTCDKVVDWGLMTCDRFNQVWNSPEDEGSKDHQWDPTEWHRQRFQCPAEPFIGANTKHPEDNTDHHSNGEEGQGQEWHPNHLTIVCSCFEVSPRSLFHLLLYLKYLICYLI